MMYRLLSAYIFLAFILTAAFSSCTSKQAEAADYVTALDSLIERRSDFEKEKLVRIGNIRRSLSQTGSTADRYMLNALLFDEFSTYASDSALNYINRNIDIARTTGDSNQLIESYLKKVDYYTATGMLTHATDLLDSINPSTLDKNNLIDYYGQKIYLYSHLGNYIGIPGNEYYDTERAYKDSIMSVIDSTHPEYLWYKGLDILGTDKDAAETITGLKKAVDNSTLNTQLDAKHAYILSKLYQQTGDLDNYKRYMALSAAADIRFYNRRELSALEELSRILYDQGDTPRAFKYVNYCLGMALAYPNRVKIFGVSDALDTITNEYQNQMLRRQESNHRTLITICILAAILAVAILFNIFLYLRVLRQKQNLDASNQSLNDRIRELHEYQEQLHVANAQLTKLNDDLKGKNYELDEANYVKEEYICSVFTLCSNYIGRIAELKKNIHINLLAKKYNVIEAETEDFDTRSELKEFYQEFDSVFLHIYPDFVRDFNNLLQPDKRIYPKEGELLNTELRIYALIRLGITDSVKIAEFLHCSPQTVYNNRFRVRNKAIVPKEDFAATVRKLGRFADSAS